MKTAYKFRERIKKEKKTPSKFYRSTALVETGLVTQMANRIEQLESEFEEIGYVPGKPQGKEHMSWWEIYGI